jgi:hypothetical protein
MCQNTIWNELLKKEANGIDDNCDLGEIQEVEADYIVTVKGIVNKLKFRIPRNLIAGFDGRTLYFGITKAQAKRYLLDNTSSFSC